MHILEYYLVLYIVYSRVCILLSIIRICIYTNRSIILWQLCYKEPEGSQAVGIPTVYSKNTAVVELHQRFFSLNYHGTMVPGTRRPRA